MSEKKPARVSVVTNDPPINKELLAEAIIRLGQEVGNLNRSGLNRKAIIILLHHYTKLSQTDIATVLDAIPQLQRAYCK